MNVLAIDTSNQVLGVAASKAGVIQAEQIINIKRNHSIGLMPAIEHVLKESNMEVNQLDRIAVAKGPGSYTGVRIGLATAKTMAWSLDIPIVAVSSLELLAHNTREKELAISPFFDARRGLVYTGLYQLQSDGMHVLQPDQNIDMKQWLEQLKEEQRPVLFLSQDLAIHEDSIHHVLGELAMAAPSIDHLPRPGILALLGGQSEETEVHALTPNYIRLVEAEANWLKEQKQHGSN
ncbi:tRNA (adenosine(37)-N6)-threonylcarbamoyltransferase complex dimerization subunit type 1 TsaB [Gracilibacillus alcaliphilus]|uniref:tRNA (adenosine(37)-N6)-threonylcarbamoyltransferase complex dimerization subunit type 1 TsaB n=1 Tax=Gracilibacillus alcaliphilus TaxID=1401441 RepID=UPI001956751B|nr:tRNA (adenosine(37)-N6)-threonylcarbamoyltransferase complex dimerization subunit type 1 TsaB [Gracilibacillus alcaliphilus]MBM7679628.1 tRNA threonylcarbamoyladenosine biosynthesis protein TsaB [Gracilibacillus alcaliphilus]